MKGRKFGLIFEFAVSLSLLIILTVTLLTFFIIMQERIRVYSDLKDKGYTIAKNLAYSSEPGIVRGDAGFLRNIIKTVKDDPDIYYVQVLDTKGNFMVKFYKSNRMKASVFNIDVPVESLHNNKAGYANIIGVVKLGISLSKVDDIMLQVFQIVFGITLGVILFGLFGVYVLTTYFLVLPLKKFAKITREVAAGDLDEKIDFVSNDELGELAQAFNQMTSDLKKSRSSLEERVKERTRELEAALIKLKEVDRIKTEFLSVVSHELKTPLTPITEFASLLSDKILGELNDKQSDALGVIRRQGLHLSNLIDGILDISRLEMGKPFTVKREMVSFADVVKDVEEAVRIDLEKANIKLEDEVPPDLPTIYADPNALKRVLLNLIGNSVKFTPKGGRLKITAAEVNGFARCCITDNGIGIAQESMGKIFEKFFQVDSSYTREAGGIGMGLAIAKGIIEAHHGKIWAESRGLGHGTTVCFQIPLSE